MGLTAALTLSAGGAYAGEYLVSNFDNGTNQHNIGYYYYYYGSGNPNKGNVDEREMVISAGSGDEYGPMSYYAQSPAGGGSCYSGPYCAALRVSPLPKQIATGTYNEFQPNGGYYPAFGFGFSLTKDDTTGYGPDFAKVEYVSFYAMTETPGVVVFFKVETVENSPLSKGCPSSGVDATPNGQCAGYRTDFPTVDKTNHHTNAYMVSFTLPDANVWVEKKFAISPYNGLATAGKAISTADNGPGLVGDLAQAPWYGTEIAFSAEKVTKIAWTINSDAQASAPMDEANVYIDDVKFGGAQVTDKFYLPPYDCNDDCVQASLGITGAHKVLSNFEGEDDPNWNSTTDYLRNSRGYYWYSYTDNVGGGTSEIYDLIENEHILDNWIMNTEGRGSGGTGRGAGIVFETKKAYKQGTKTIQPFVGIGANLYHDTTETDFLNASAFEGVYFEYWTSSGVEKVNVEITDECDARGLAADQDGEVLFCQVNGTNEAWKAVKIPFSRLRLASWVGTSGTRRGPGELGRCGTTLNTGYLAQLKFKVEGEDITEEEIKIDNVSFYGASEWGTPNSVRQFARNSAKVTATRASYSRGVIGVSGSVAQNIASGKLSLVNVKGRTVASAQLVKSGTRVTANLGKGTIPTGMYFVRINAKDVQGKKVVQQVPLTIVK